MAGVDTGAVSQVGLLAFFISQVEHRAYVFPTPTSFLFTFWILATVGVEPLKWHPKI